jgi:hypothetical protein
MLTSAVHDPWQLAWHFASHVADGGVAVQLPWHSLEHVALHDASHWAWSAAALHLPLHVPSQRVLQLPSQSNWPWVPVHCAVQSPWQLPVQLASTVPWHWPWQLPWSCAAHAAWNETGVHCTLQSAPTSTLHWALAWTSMFPHASMPARALETIEEPASATPRAKKRTE